MWEHVECVLSSVVVYVGTCRTLSFPTLVYVLAYVVYVEHFLSFYLSISYHTAVPKTHLLFLSTR